MIPDNRVIPAAVVAFAFLAWVAVRLTRLTRSRDFTRAARLATTFGVLWGVGLLAVTLGGRPRDESGTFFFNWVPFATQTAAADTEIVMNVLLFMPAGFVLPWIARHANRRRVVLVAFVGAAVISSMIEALQTFTPLGTAGDLTDILLNTAGCTLAAIIAASVRHQLAVSRDWRLP
ncbi:VanZ family protein [Kribbella monticola]|uniref:VanZ family protein n=1 Tax=Kribbella monticola TaxID=2185285 RepID=UPI0013008F07|nr:VanZ family protein [Kribbella monticola]